MTAFNAPTQSVLTTGELIEAIFLHVPAAKYLLIAQRVCKYWWSMIQQSPAIQQIFCQKPITCTKSDNVIKRNRILDSYDTMLAKCHIQRLQQLQGLTRRRTTPERGIAAGDVGYGSGKNACLCREPLSSTLGSLCQQMDLMTQWWNGSTCSQAVTILRTRRG